MSIETKFAPYEKVAVRIPDESANNADFRARTLASLQVIASFPLGKLLLDEIEGTEHTVMIEPLQDGKSSNECKTAGEKCYVRLRQALENWADADLREEMDYSFTEARNHGLNISMIAANIARGYSVVSTRAETNVSKPSVKSAKFEIRKFDGNIPRSKNGQPVVKTSRLDTADVEKLLLEAMATGSRNKLINIKRAGRTLADDLVRALNNPQRGHEFLRRGTGSGSLIYYDPIRSKSCWGDKQIERPPTIGLVHELIHAWRNAVGLRLYKVKNDCPPSVPDDEVMTVGMPPYAYELFSENLFRSLWNTKPEHAKLDIRNQY
jgi:hypothetical protein